MGVEKVEKESHKAINHFSSKKDSWQRIELVKLAKGGVVVNYPKSKVTQNDQSKVG